MTGLFMPDSMMILRIIRRERERFWKNEANNITLQRNTPLHA